MSNMALARIGGPIYAGQLFSLVDPGAAFVVLPGVGHLAGLEAPEIVNAEIERFLATLAPTRP